MEEATPENLPRMKVGTKSFKPSWTSRSSFAVWFCKECAEMSQGASSCVLPSFFHTLGIRT